jgi:hypothetical protein
VGPLQTGAAATPGERAVVGPLRHASIEVVVSAHVVNFMRDRRFALERTTEGEMDTPAKMSHDRALTTCHFAETRRFGVVRRDALAAVAVVIFLTTVAGMQPTVAMAQSVNLSGTWEATGYVCRGAEPPQRIRIVHSGTTVTAVKITGDDCVRAGQITWRGTFQERSFPAEHHVSRGPGTAQFFIPVRIDIQSADRITVNVGLVYRKIAPAAALPLGVVAAILGVVLAHTMSSRRTRRELGWMEIELVDEVGDPVADEPFRVTLPDGETREGMLDRFGRARVENFRPGPGYVNFPQRDAELWHPIGSSHA